MVKWCAQLGWSDTEQLLLWMRRRRRTIMMKIIKILIIVISVFISKRISDLPVNNATTIYDFLLTLQSRKGKQQVLSSRETIERGEASPQGRGGMGSTPL